MTLNEDSTSYGQMNVSEMMWVFLILFFWLWINIKTIKTLGFNDNTHLLGLSRLYVPSLTEIQYSQIEQSEKGIYFN